MKGHETTDKEKSAEVAYMDGRLKHATEVIQVRTDLDFQLHMMC